MITSTNPVTPPDLIDNIKELIEICGPTVNKNDKAIVAIKLCISEGVDTKDHIVRSLMRAGFNNAHAGSVLTKSTGRSPKLRHWWLDSNGRYHVHEDEPAPAA